MTYEVTSWQPGTFILKVFLWVPPFTCSLMAVSSLQPEQCLELFAKEHKIANTQLLGKVKCDTKNSDSYKQTVSCSED